MVSFFHSFAFCSFEWKQILKRGLLAGACVFGNGCHLSHCYSRDHNLREITCCYHEHRTFTQPMEVLACPTHFFRLLLGGKVEIHGINWNTPHLDKVNEWEIFSSRFRCSLSWASCTVETLFSIHVPRIPYPQHYVDPPHWMWHTQFLQGLQIMSPMRLPSPLHANSRRMI